MSTDPYPEVSVDESGIVPPQGARPAEWPKKLRTLTAAELDRLTIDNSGRFYWDGKLVSYDTQTKQLTDKSGDFKGQPLKTSLRVMMGGQQCKMKAKAGDSAGGGTSTTDGNPLGDADADALLLAEGLDDVGYDAGRGQIDSAQRGAGRPCGWTTLGA